VALRQRHGPCLPFRDTARSTPNNRSKSGVLTVVEDAQAVNLWMLGTESVFSICVNPAFEI